jgi:hypothetical protein
MLQVYRPLYHIPHEWLFVLEDDVLPPHGVISSLLEHIDYDVAGVSGVVPSRYGNRVIAGNTGEEGESLSGSGVQPVTYTGFGCLLLRRSALHSVRPFTTGNYDVQFCKDLQKNGWRWLLNWNVKCQHGYIER